MIQNINTLHLLCGRIASGKSTLATELGNNPATVTISEDSWLSTLYKDEMSSLADYVRCSTKLQEILAPHVALLLNAGVSVVLDFPANTIASRLWMRDIIDTIDVAHQLHFLDVPFEVCLDRLHQRNNAGDHPFIVTDDQFTQISKHFVAPSDEEGFNVVRHKIEVAKKP